MRELLAERNTALATMGERVAEKRVGEALAAGCITPAMRPWALALCREKPDSFEGFLAAGAPAYAHLLRPVAPRGPPPRGVDAAARASPEARAICRQLDLDPEGAGRLNEFGNGESRLRSRPPAGRPAVCPGRSSRWPERARP